MNQSVISPCVLQLVDPESSPILAFCVQVTEDEIGLHAACRSVLRYQKAIDLCDILFEKGWYAANVVIMPVRQDDRSNPIEAKVVQQPD